MHCPGVLLGLSAESQSLRAQRQQGLTDSGQRLSRFRGLAGPSRHCPQPLKGTETVPGPVPTPAPLQERREDPPGGQHVEVWVRFCWARVNAQSGNKGQVCVRVQVRVRVEADGGADLEVTGVSCSFPAAP